MKATVRAFLLAGAILMAGCATPEKPVVVDSAVTTVTASAEQLLLGKHRGASIYERWSEEKRTQFLKSTSPQLAVKTLGLNPEQVASLGGKIPAPETALCVVIWDAKTAKIVGMDGYIVVTPPAKGVPARFGPHTAIYVGSL